MTNDKNTDKIYKYEVLLQAIDFFSQKFTIQELAENAFIFVNKLLPFNSSVLFIKENDLFVQKNTRNYHFSGYTIPNSKSLQSIATYVGNILVSSFDNFFNKEDIIQFNIKIVIPLIIYDKLYGFILSDGKTTNEFDEDDLKILNAFMRIVNNSLENIAFFNELQQTNKKLDKKIFDLFSVYQSSKLLFSQLDLDSLYSLAVDIFSEVTSSKVTSFGLYDEISQKILIKGYKNVSSFSKYYDEFELNDLNYNASKIVLHIKRDNKIIKKLFKNSHKFEHLEAEYIVLIIKDQTITGFVTLSKTTNETTLDDSIFELVESLATSTCIALSNALLFREVNRQKALAEYKFQTLYKLNKLIKNINSCTNLKELCQITIQTLHIAFGIKKALIALNDNDEFLIFNHIGFEKPDNKLAINSSWNKLSEEGIIYKHSSSFNHEYFSGEFLNSIGESNCLVISAIKNTQVLINENSILGYIIVFQTSESLKEEEILLIDTISNNIGAVIKHLKTMESIKLNYVVNQREAFLSELKTKLYNQNNYYIPVYIYYKKILQLPFVQTELTDYKEYEHYYFDNILFVLSETEIEKDIFDGCITADNLEDFFDKIKQIQL